MRLTWTKEKPTEPGAYWLRGYKYSDPRRQVLVEVRRWRGELRCNISDPPDDDHYDGWPYVADIGLARWCGPLVPPNG